MDEPFVLTSFAASTLPPTVSAVGYTKSAKEDGRLLVSAIGVGVNLYDLADQTTLAALTLGNAFRPTTTAVSRSTPISSTESVRIKGSRKTWIGVEAPGTTEEGQLLCWTEEERKDGSTEGNAIKIEYPFTNRISAILAPTSLPTSLVILSSTGSLSIAPESTPTALVSTPPSAIAPTTQSLQLFPLNSASTSILPSSIVSLIPKGSKPHLAVIVRSFGGADKASSMVEISKKKFKKTKRPSSASLIDAADEEVVESAGEKQMEIELVLLDAEVVNEGGIVCVGVVSLGTVAIDGTQVVVSEQGFVTSLDKAGLLSSFRLSFTGASVFPSTYPELFGDSTETTELVLSPLKTFPLSLATLSSTSATGITLLALHSSFVLLASVRPRLSNTLTPEDPPTKIITLVWDVRLGAVVSQVKISVPSAALPTPETTTSRHVCVALQSISKRYASLIVSPTVGLNGRSVVFVIPLSLPSESVLAIVIGKQALTKKYLAGGESIIVKASKSEPMRHPRTTKTKLALIESSELARSTLLAKLETLLLPLEHSKSSDLITDAVARADELFATFVSNERAALVAYNARKLIVSKEKEKERRNLALEEKDRLQTTTKKYRLNKARIELAIAEAGESDWKDVTAKRIKGVTDIYRYKYFEVRSSLEEELGGEVAGEGVEKMTKAIARQEPALPSSFVTALLRLCFPGTVYTYVDLRTTATTRVWKHPTGIVAYLLERKLVGDSMVEGGLLRFLGRAGDWANIVLALKNVVDIPESTTVALLKTVTSHHLSPTSLPSSSPSALPQSPPSLSDFLAAFLDAPSTPSVLRQAIQTQLSALEVMPILTVLEGWLGWWAARGGGGGDFGLKDDWSKESKSKTKRLASNPFLALGGEAGEEDVPPRVQLILPLISIILDAHFVTLLLQRQSHALLRRLNSRITTSLTTTTDLATLLGPLSIYSRARKEAQSTKSTAAGAVEEESRKKEGAKAMGESMEKRVKAQEKHMDVGEYAVDKFWL